MSAPASRQRSGTPRAVAALRDVLRDGATALENALHEKGETVEMTTTVLKLKL